ncbi:MAG TPA: hypothetical protein VG900_15635 [Hyphomicrobiaceae bacterium]|nr:hypothetical protein [Hyphomicrobiaceae bacterium]
MFRLRGAYFAIGTWVVAEVYRLVFAQFRHSAVARARRPLAIVAMLFASKGIWGFLSDRGAPAVFPLRRRLHDAGVQRGANGDQPAA